MAAEPVRVALLARAGVARDRLRAVIAEAGAMNVLEEDPAALDPADLSRSAPQLVLVALDAQTGDALERFDEVLFDPLVDVIYEEAELAATREGWDVARWQRHLVAKLQRHADVLPPGREPEDDEAPGAPDLPLSDGPSADAEPQSGDWSFADMEPESRDASFADAEHGTGERAFAPPEPSPEEGGSDDADLQWDGSFPAPGPDAGPGDPPLAPVQPDADALDAGSGFDPVLAEFDEDLPGVMRTGDTPADEAEVRGRFERDLEDLESRIAGLSLVQDIGQDGDTQGAIVVLAGIGGPDAVRQFLGALPTTLSRPVLVSQQLDGGRYDKLVAQMQRATGLPVVLAADGEMLQPGMVHIVPADLGVEPAADGARFRAGAPLVGPLPAADSAVVLLSGSDPALLDELMKQRAAGALVVGQAAEGCYDPVASDALRARGGETAAPAELAARVAGRWAQGGATT